MSAVKVTNDIQAHVASDPTRGPRADMSGTIQRLARRLGIPASELAAKIPADTIRRTKNPAIEQTHEDGSTSFVPVKQLITAPRSSATN